MKKVQIGSGTILLIGYISIGLALASVVADHVNRLFFGYPFNIGLVVANGDLAVIGILALVVGRCLRKLEIRVADNAQRIDKVSQ